MSDEELAKLIAEKFWDELKLYKHGWELEHCMGAAASVLAAVRPLIRREALEEAAKVADDRVARCGSPTCERCREDLAVATFIRLAAAPNPASGGKP